MSDVALRVQNLSKLYHIGGLQAQYKTLRESLVGAAQAPFRRMGRLLHGQAHGASDLDQTIWALKDVTFELKHGEVLGIIGRNGAGKSTLLKILSRITAPTEGSVDLYGRVGSLLEVGTGFHPELTGRENIYLNGAVLGMKKAEIKRKFDEIVAFSEIEKFLDTPVKHYSSGMYVRLAFAVAAHLEPEILLVDEVLAVGDVAFQKKCLGKMKDVAVKGRTVLFVSHNMAAIQILCGKAMVLDMGMVRYIGPTKETIEDYMSMLEYSSAALDVRGDRMSSPAWYTAAVLQGPAGTNHGTAISGQPFDIRLYYRAQKPGLKLQFAIGVYSSFGEKLLHLGTHYSSLDHFVSAKEGEVVCRFDRLPLPEGSYRINLSLYVVNERVDHVIGASRLHVIQGDFYGTGKTPKPSENRILVEHIWTHRHLEAYPSGNENNRSRW